MSTSKADKFSDSPFSLFLFLLVFWWWVDFGRVGYKSRTMPPLFCPLLVVVVVVVVRVSDGCLTVLTLSLSSRHPAESHGRQTLMITSLKELPAATDNETGNKPKVIKANQKKGAPLGRTASPRRHTHAHTHGENWKKNKKGKG